MKLKQYKLKRDLPTFKAGSEFIVCCGNLIEVKTDGTLGVCAYSGSTLKKFPNILTDWFEEIKPAEPLIKDEKIRKAVRAWVDLYGYKFVTHRFYSTTTGYRWSLLVRETQEICLPELDGLDESKDYTIAELCGEDEE